MESINMTAPLKQRSWLNRLIRFTIFSGYPDWPWKNKQLSYGVSTEVDVVLDWKDRLRVLFGGVIVIKICVDTAEDVTAIETRSAASVVHPGIKKYLVMGSK